MNAHHWSPEEYEEVNCCRCGMPGHLLYRQQQFGIVKCPQCALVFTSPRLKKEAIRKIYEDSSYFDNGVYGFSKTFSAAMLLQKAWTCGRLHLIGHLLGGNVHGKKMLEIGCAYGLFLEHAQHQGFDVTGVEYSCTAVAWTNTHLNVQVYRGELHDVHLLPKDYDVICFWDVLEHVDNPMQFLELVGQYVKPGGIVVFSTPDLNSIPAHLLRARWWTLRPEQHLSHFTSDTLKVLFADANMHLEQVIRNPFALVNIGRLDVFVGVARAS